MPNLTEIMTTDPAGTAQSRRWLGQHAYMSNLVYSYTLPGGCDTLTCHLNKPPRWRTDVINPGRRVYAIRGATVVWSGVLDEPVPTADGWDLTAHGAGKFGDDYLAIYTGYKWDNSVINHAVDLAIDRGLRWTRRSNIVPGAAGLGSLFIGQKVDDGGQTITDLLNLGCEKGGLTWCVRTGAGGENALTVFPIPGGTPNRVLHSLTPEARAIADGPSTLYARYQATWDSVKRPATYALTSVTSAAEEAKHGRREDLMDISSAGVYHADGVQSIARSALARFQRAAFADPFTVQPGELMSKGGVPVDLGTFWADNFAAMVCQVWLGDFGEGGEVEPAAMHTFLAGGYSYDQDAGTAQITPFESARHNFGSVMQAIVDSTPVRVQPKAKKRTTKQHHAASSTRRTRR